MRQSKVHSSLHAGMWIGLTLLVFGGCVSLNTRTIYPEKHYYAVEVTRPGEPRVPVPQTILKVRKFRISPSFAGKQFVSRTSEARYEADFYHEWFILPKAMLTQQVLNWQTRAGLFQYVMDSSGSMQATHTLEGNVTALFGDDRGTPSKAVLGLQFFLLSEAPNPETVVWHREYREEVDLPEQSPETLVKGWNEALRRILSALEEDLVLNISPR